MVLNLRFFFGYRLTVCKYPIRCALRSQVIIGNDVISRFFFSLWMCGNARV